MSKSEYILAIDLGTSGPKVAFVAPDGRVVGGASTTIATHLLPDHGAEQDPAEWWTAIVAAMEELRAEHPVPADEVIAVCCTTQWSGAAPVDRDGKPLGRAMIWMDARGAPYVKEITDGLLKIEGYGAAKLWQWLRLTGGIPTRSGKDSIAHILYLKAERPLLYQATHKFLEPKDYLNLRLTGRFAASYDSITLHWLTDNRDIYQIDYHPRLLRLAGIERKKLPDLRPSTAILGPLLPEAAAALGVPAGIPVIMGSPDIHSAAIGSGAARDYAANLYVGTSSWLTCHVPYKKTDLFHNMASLPAALPGRYLLINEQEVAGGCLHFLRDNLLYSGDGLGPDAPPEDFYRRLNALVAATPPGSNGVLFLPWLNGERTPVDERTLRGGFHNLGLETTRADMVRAVYEGVALNARWLLYYVERFIKRRIAAINIAGGGAQSAVWCQIHADVLNRPIHQVADPLQVNTRGAGLLAALALGRLTVDEIGDAVPIQQTFTPNPAHRELYDDYFDCFRRFYEDNRKAFGRMNG